MNDSNENKNIRLLNNLIKTSELPNNESFCGVDIITPENNEETFLYQNTEIPYIIKVYYAEEYYSNFQLNPKTQRIIDNLTELHDYIKSFVPFNIEINAKRVKSCDGYDYLMKRKYTNEPLKESIKKILKEETQKDKNIDGGRLKMCSTSPMTGYYRDGYCKTGDDDTGSHTVCSKVTKEFLEFTKSKGNNLDMLEPGDKWCLCAKRWKEADDEGVSPFVVRSSTNIKTLDIIGGIEKELTEYARTLKNARRQGVGLRFPKSAIKANPLRFRPYNR